MKPLPLLLALPAASAYVTTTTWTTSRVVTVLSPQYHFYPIYASVVTANATATVYALDCQDNWHLDDDAPLAGCNGFTSLQAVIRVPTSTITEATFTATSTGSNGMRFVPPTPPHLFPRLVCDGGADEVCRTISNDCKVDAIRMVCTSRLDGDTVPPESKGDRVDTLPVESNWLWASGEKFTVTAGLEYLPAETETATTGTGTGTGTTGPSTGSGGTGLPKETGTSGAGRRWEGMGAVGLGAMGVVVGLV